MTSLASAVMVNDCLELRRVVAANLMMEMAYEALARTNDLQKLVASGNSGLDVPDSKGQSFFNEGENPSSAPYLQEPGCIPGDGSGAALCNAEPIKYTVASSNDASCSFSQSEANASQEGESALAVPSSEALPSQEPASDNFCPWEFYEGAD